MDNRQWRELNNKLDRIEAILLMNTFLVVQQDLGRTKASRTWDVIKGHVKSLMSWVKINDITEKLPDDDPGRI